MGTLGWIILATLLVSLLSLIGVIAISMSEKRLNRILLLLVGFAAGALIGGAFLHLMPEAIEDGVPDTVFGVVIIGFITFFALEKVLWRHCHERTCEIHTFAYLNLIGDGLHNLIDGIIIAASFLIDIRLGFATTIAVALHEIPQEIGDFAVLVHGGLSRKKALSYNFLTALAALAGGISAFYFLPLAENAMGFIIPFAAGGFIYIAASDLIPELHKDTDKSRAIASSLTFVLGVGLMWLFKIVFEG